MLHEEREDVLLVCEGGEGVVVVGF
jgi:hypothetical protein